MVEHLNNNQKHLGLKAAKWIFGILLIVYLISRIDPADVLNALQGCDKLKFTIGFMAFGASRFIEGFRLHIFIKKYGFKIGQTLRIFFISMFFNNLSTTLVGDGYKVVAIKQRVNNLQKPFAVVLLERTIGFLVTIFLGITYVVYDYQRVVDIINIHQVALRINHLQYYLISILFVFAVLIIFRKKFVKVLNKIKDLVNKIKLTLNDLVPFNIIFIIILTVLSHLLIAFHIYILVQSFVETINFFDIIFVNFVAFLASYLPLSIGALGIREGAVVAALLFFNVTGITATAVAIASRLSIYFFALIGGILFSFGNKSIAGKNQEQYVYNQEKKPSKIN